MTGLLCLFLNERSARHFFHFKADSTGVAIKYRSKVIKPVIKYEKMCVGVEKGGSYIQVKEYVTACG